MVLLLLCCCLSDSLLPHDLQASLSFTISWNLHKLMSTESVMPSNYLTLCHPLLLLPLIFPSTRVFSSETALHIRWSKYWSFSFSISPSNEYSGLISSRINWLDLLAVQGILKSLLQHHSWKASTLQHSLPLWPNSYLHMTIGKTVALTIWTFIGKVTSLLFNKLSRFVIVFLPRRKSFFNFVAAVTMHSEQRFKLRASNLYQHVIMIYMMFTLN